eukprot:365203_1
MFNILSPLYNVLNDEKRDILSSIMFTNTIKLTYKTLNKTSENLRNNMNKIDIEMVKFKNFVECKDIKCFSKLLETNLDEQLTWLSRNNDAVPLIFPILAKLLDFQNPAALCLNLPAYANDIADLIEDGIQSWALKECIEQSNINTNDLKNIMERLETEYDNKGVFDIYDEKEPFIYDIQLNCFNICIKEIKNDMLNNLNINKEWKDMCEVSSDNYVISFEDNDLNNGLYDVQMKDLKQKMQIHSYLLIGEQKNEIMHFLDKTNMFIQYGATILNASLSDDKFIDYYKKEDINIRKENNFYDNDNNDHKLYNINNNDIYFHEPPIKKIKTNNNKKIHIKTENKRNVLKQQQQKSIAQINTADISDDIPIIEHKNNGRKRKREELIDSPTPIPLSNIINNTKIKIKEPSPPKEEIIIPKSFSECKKFKYLNIKNGVGWAYNVPIYNEYYWDCANFEIDSKFDMINFAKLCIESATRKNIEIEKELRGGRKRIIVKEDEADCAFINSVPDEKYKQLFEECFTWKESEMNMRLDIDLRDYCDKEKLLKRKNREFIVFERYYFIRKDMKYRLNLLLNILKKHNTYGVVKIPVILPAWYQNEEFGEAEQLALQFKCIDLTNVESDSDENQDYDVYMKYNKNANGNQEIRIKKEFMSEDEYED